MQTLIIAPSHSSFIHKDYEILKAMTPTELEVTWSIKQIFKTSFKVFHSDTCIFWFASIRFIPIFILAKILGKKTIVIAGGYDVSVICDLKYGGVRPSCRSTPLRKLFLSFCDRVITVSDSNTMEAKLNAHVPVDKIERIYLGFDLPQIELKPWKDRKNQVVFIGGCDHTSIKIKGFDVFLELAKAMPHLDFIHIGSISEKKFELQAQKIKNVKLMGYIKNLSPVFSDLLNSSKVILLPSKIESFGASILEGALHGCLPVTSNKYALPEVLGEMGRVCSLDHLNQFEKAINEVVNGEIDPKAIQNYYFRRFNTDQRKNALKKLLNL